jgi:hypothetical protein
VSFIVNKEYRANRQTYCAIKEYVGCARIEAAARQSNSVHLWTKFGKRTIVAATTAIVLALCVFLWGLGYKLSLYHPPHSFARLVPIAKLLSKNEQPRIAASSIAGAAAAEMTPSRAITGGSEHLSVAVLLIVLCLSTARTWSRQAVTAPLRRVDRACSYFVRPPPFLT